MNDYKEKEFENWTQDEIFTANRLCDFLSDMYLKYFVKENDTSENRRLLTQKPSVFLYVDLFFIICYYYISWDSISL